MIDDKFGAEKAKGDAKRGVKNGFLLFFLGPLGYLFLGDHTAPKRNFLPTKSDLIRTGIVVLFCIILGTIIYFVA